MAPKKRISLNIYAVSAEMPRERVGNGNSGKEENFADIRSSLPSKTHG